MNTSLLNGMTFIGVSYKTLKNAGGVLGFVQNSELGEVLLIDQMKDKGLIANRTYGIDLNPPGTPS